MIISLLFFFIIYLILHFKLLLSCIVLVTTYLNYYDNDVSKPYLYEDVPELLNVDELKQRIYEKKNQKHEININ